MHFFSAVLHAKAFAVTQAPSRSPPIFLSMVRMEAERATALPKVDLTISNQGTWHFGTSVFSALGFFLEGAQRNRSPYAVKHGPDMYIPWRRSRVFGSYAAKASFCQYPLKPQTLASLPLAPFRMLWMQGKIKRRTALTLPHILGFLVFLVFFLFLLLFLFLFPQNAGLWTS